MEKHPCTQEAEVSLSHITKPLGRKGGEERGGRKRGRRMDRRKGGSGGRGRRNGRREGKEEGREGRREEGKEAGREGEGKVRTGTVFSERVGTTQYGCPHPSCSSVRAMPRLKMSTQRTY